MPKLPAKKSNPVTTAELNAAAKRVSAKVNSTVPLWTGPAGEGPNGGVTQSLLGRYLADPERCRVQYVEGWHAADRFNDRIEYGNMWHVCEEAAASEVRHFRGELGGTDTTLWSDRLTDYCDGLLKRYQSSGNDILLTHDKCREMFHRYHEYWRNHPDQVARRPLLQEHKFDVPYRLPSGRTVRLRGKWDSVDLIPTGQNSGVWLQENKTKSTVDAVKLARQLKFDLQTMTYLIALKEKREKHGDTDTEGFEGRPIRGVRYNVIRRPAHKSVESMIDKLELDCRNRRDGEWFTRFNVEVSMGDIGRFRRRCLDPLLENLLDDYEWWDRCLRAKTDPYDYQTRANKFGHHQRRHFVMPYGVYSPLTEGGSGDIDEYVHTGSTAALRKPTTLFEELT